MLQARLGEKSPGALQGPRAGVALVLVAQPAAHAVTLELAWAAVQLPSWQAPVSW